MHVQRIQLLKLQIHIRLHAFQYVQVGVCSFFANVLLDNNCGEGAENGDGYQHGENEMIEIFQEKCTVG
ncbi:hypothetical protein D3C74_453060 [compost metagenome]